MSEISNQQDIIEKGVIPFPVIVELIAEASDGKTHLSLLFSNPALADLTEMGESVEIVRKLYPDDCDDRYFRCKTFQDVRTALNQAHIDGRKTFIIETGSHLRLIIGIEALQEIQKNKAQRSSLHPTEWKYVNAEMSKFLSKIKEEFKMNLIISAQMDDEWKKKEKTGKRKNQSYPKMDHIADIRLFIKVKEVEEGETTKKVRVGKVLKNRLVNKLSSDFTKEIMFESDNNPEALKSFKKILAITKIDESRWVM